MPIREDFSVNVHVRPACNVVKMSVRPVQTAQIPVMIFRTGVPGKRAANLHVSSVKEIPVMMAFPRNVVPVFSRTVRHANPATPIPSAHVIRKQRDAHPVATMRGVMLAVKVWVKRTRFVDPAAVVVPVFLRVPLPASLPVSLRGPFLPTQPQGMQQPALQPEDRVVLIPVRADLAVPAGIREGMAEIPEQQEAQDQQAVPVVPAATDPGQAAHHPHGRHHA